MEETAVDFGGIPGLSCFVDVFDRADLFDQIDNHTVVRLSSLGQKTGFSSVDAVQKSTGIAHRRILKHGVTSVDLATAVFDRLCSVSEFSPAEFPVVLLCHSGIHDQAAEQLAVALEDHYSLPPKTVLPFNFGCSGFLKLLLEGTMLLTDRSTTKRIALLNVETPETWHDGSDRLFCGIVSAGATGCVLSRNGGLPLSVVRAGDFMVPPALRMNPDPLFRKETCKVFSFRGEPENRTVMRMNAETVFVNGIELMLNNLRSAVSSIDCQLGQRVIVIPHQPSGKLLKALIAAARIEFPEFEFLNNLHNFGNTISAAVPTIMSRLPQVLFENGCQPVRDGDLIILLVAGICMHEIADHMSAGHACLEWVSSERQVASVETSAMLR
ncbi:MAG TPA: 3-oxoacyl-[acyl-carrier-protein] synthase III C-terminal domain-containing protein [Planctomycetaceae bacterium]|nr:3-oxoacyl-[acyl-carrier-protein] synthase III C-terminal domain-containing protein [Planctomycetaceae bacterium]